MEKICEILKNLRQNTMEKYFDRGTYKESIVVEQLGEIKITTGEIVACDPLVLYQNEPFTVKVPMGSYPVYLYILNIDDDKRVAFAEVRFSENIPINYEMALVEGQNLSELENDEFFFGYGVDSGIGCFMDKIVCDELSSFDDLFEPLEKTLNDSYIDTYSVANIMLPSDKGNIVAFSTGYGDGAYGSYFGHDEKDKVCCLISEFQSIDLE